MNMLSAARNTAALLGCRYTECQMPVLCSGDCPRRARSGGPTVDDPDRPYCKSDQSCCDFACGN